MYDVTEGLRGLLEPPTIQHTLDRRSISTGRTIEFGKLLGETAVLALVCSPRADRLAQLRIHLSMQRWDAARKLEPPPSTR
jgi:hypothetical protein